MAGVIHGPVPWLKSNVVVQYVETDAARELFELCSNGDSINGEQSKDHVSVRTWKAVRKVLDSNVNVVCVASWMDQVVPLFSGLMAAFDHPNLLRAVYIDSHNFKPDFLHQFIVYLLNLRNMGIPDRHLLFYLSETVAGSLYGGVEHSTIYNESKVYE
jgi:hypothetical protein